MVPAKTAFPVRPRLISSAHGPIRRVLLWYGRYTKGMYGYKEIYAGLLRQLPTATEVVIAAHPSVADEVTALANEHRPDGRTVLSRRPTGSRTPCGPRTPSRSSWMTGCLRR